MSFSYLVCRGENSFSLGGTVDRVPRQHAGWQSVRYKGKWFCVQGGGRIPLFINVDYPLSA